MAIYPEKQSFTLLLVVYFSNLKMAAGQCSRNIRIRNNKYVTACFLYFTLKKCIASGYCCLLSNCIHTLIYLNKGAFLTIFRIF